MPTLRTTVDTVCTVITLAAAWSGKVEPIYKDGDGLSQGLADDPGGDSPLSPILDYAGDPTQDHLQTYLRRLGSDEIGDLLALLFIGRDELSAAGWAEAVRRADELAAATDGVRLLLESPHLAAHLESALQELGIDCPEDRLDDHDRP